MNFAGCACVLVVFATVLISVATEHDGADRVFAAHFWRQFMSVRAAAGPDRADGHIVVRAAGRAIVGFTLVLSEKNVGPCFDRLN